MPTNAPLPRVKQAGEATDAKGQDAIREIAVTFPTQLEIAPPPNALLIRVNVMGSPFARSNGTFSHARSIAS
jgi:hypothetical protein